MLELALAQNVVVGGLRWLNTDITCQVAAVESIASRTRYLRQRVDGDDKFVDGRVSGVSPQAPHAAQLTVWG